MSSVFKFIGKDGSQNLKRGNHYALELHSNSPLNGGLVACMWSADHSLMFWSCPYNGLIEFSNNWVKVL